MPQALDSIRLLNLKIKTFSLPIKRNFRLIMGEIVKILSFDSEELLVFVTQDILLHTSRRLFFV